MVQMLQNKCELTGPHSDVTHSAHAVQDMHFHTPMARILYSILFDPPVKRSVAEMFQPRRMAFVYELDEQDHSTDMPTTLRRSKEDCPAVSSLHIIKLVKSV